jgi:hypothetical protein
MDPGRVLAKYAAGDGGLLLHGMFQAGGALLLQGPDILGGTDQIGERSHGTGCTGVSSA